MRPGERNTFAPDSATVRAEPTSVVRRVSEILGAFGHEDRALGVNEIARRTGIPKATVSRLVAELVDEGMLERHGAQIVLGLRLFELGERASRRRSMREVALPFLADLRAATGQTVHLAVLDGSEVVYVEILRGRGGPTLPSGVGLRLPAHATGVGKALLAAAPPDVLQRILERGLAPVGPRTITAPGALLAHLRRIAASGMSYEHEESAAGVACVASAIVPDGGPAVGAVSATGWIGKVDIRRVGPAVRTTALTIARELAAAEP
ncbi:IclR family transcriptional regulator [Tsukamurella sp. 8F]|uniref:IclR family transcriptional regulator n=1 Tax=unclassified Tsukamurella TaxID=2633480 RepID=UPI0023B92ABA|nr:MULTISPECIES: IclR family transcriptional regulator [unclassified Tsukamurella]MDF0529320.1 IclR family transcriptional regulator [Tsukamurella sp. 8J]MDF0587173.1 IclR family transcriptional regulator [Tsukamurella sp. 8F]